MRTMKVRPETEWAVEVGVDLVVIRIMKAMVMDMEGRTTCGWRWWW